MLERIRDILLIVASCLVILGFVWWAAQQSLFALSAANLRAQTAEQRLQQCEAQLRK